MPTTCRLTVGADVRGQHLLLLEDCVDHRLIQVEIEISEARVVGQARRRVGSAAEDAYGVIEQALAVNGQRLLGVALTGSVADVFQADLFISRGARIVARPSVAVVLALRGCVPIMIEETLLDVVGMSAAGPQAELDPADRLDVDQFRRFLDEVTPDDFAAS